MKTRFLRTIAKRANVTLAVGDIHGCYKALKRALRELDKLQRPTVFLGDYVDRGPSSVKTVDLLVAAKEAHPDWTFIKGNHEDLLINALAQNKQGHRFGPVDAFEEYNELPEIPSSHQEFFKGLTLYHETDHFLLMHGGISNASGPLEEKDPQELMWTYEITPDWSGKKIVRGHNIVAAAEERPNHINLDTGCFHFGWLSIGVLDEDAGRLLGTIQVSRCGKYLREIVLISPAEQRLLKRSMKTSRGENDFHSKFKKVFGADFPLETNETLLPIRPCVWGTSCARRILSSNGLPMAHSDFSESDPDYCLMGFWGYGMNSYAFYYICKKGEHLTYLRIAYGGAFMNNEEAAQNVLKILIEYQRTMQFLGTNFPEVSYDYNMGRYGIKIGRNE